MGYELEVEADDQSVVCGACSAQTYYLGIAPRFCPHCGAKLPEGGERIEEAS